MKLASLAALVLAACSSFDGDVFPKVSSASLHADPAAPEALASVDIALRLEPGWRADRPVTLRSVELWRAVDPPSRAAHLELAFPDGDEIEVDQPQVVKLVNVGTTNGDLAPLCGQTFTLTVQLAYPEDASGWNGTGGGAPGVSVVCD